jgi:predicted ATPase
MIEWIEFNNFKALRKAKLPLGRFTLIVGANGSGKSTALSSILGLAKPSTLNVNQVRSAGASQSEQVTLVARWSHEGDVFLIRTGWGESGASALSFTPIHSGGSSRAAVPKEALDRARIFSFDSDAIARPVSLLPKMELERNGANLPGVLDRMRDQAPERFEALNQELTRWIPEFDKILFETPGQGQRSLALRTREGGHLIKAQNLSQGTLIALALLTIAYMPQPPSIICLEEPDHGLHPRLLRDIRDALYRLAHPEGVNEKRDPVQIIATTHNPYFLDLFREHPEEIVIAEKIGLESKFSRLSDREDLEEILGDASLSEVWYSGVLGGVPTGA